MIYVLQMKYQSYILSSNRIYFVFLMFNVSNNEEPTITCMRT